MNMAPKQKNGDTFSEYVATGDMNTDPGVVALSGVSASKQIWGPPAMISECKKVIVWVAAALGAGLLIMFFWSNASPAKAGDFRTGNNSPQIYAPDGTYLGNLNNNRYDPNSIANPYGQYGSRYSPNSVNNPYGTYGNPYSSQYSNPYGRR